MTLDELEAQVHHHFHRAVVVRTRLADGSEAVVVEAKLVFAFGDLDAAHADPDRLAKLARARLELAAATHFRPRAR